MRNCSVCKSILQKHQHKYCSNSCQHENQYLHYVKKWKAGLVDGNRGKKTRLVSKHIRKYLFSKYSSQCAKCKWNKINPRTKLVPLEINHIDGNANNNAENNLELLCPNCHALTPNFRNLNKGKGRSWRK